MIHEPASFHGHPEPLHTPEGRPDALSRRTSIRARSPRLLPVRSGVELPARRLSDHAKKIARLITPPALYLGARSARDRMKRRHSLSQASEGRAVYLRGISRQSGPSDADPLIGGRSPPRACRRDPGSPPFVVVRRPVPCRTMRLHIDCGHAANSIVGQLNLRQAAANFSYRQPTRSQRHEGSARDATNLRCGHEASMHRRPAVRGANCV